MAERSKTSISLERKVRYIPVAFPMTDFTDPSWVEPRLAVRKKLKLVGGANIPLMPSPAEVGGWSKVPVPVGSAASWLRGLLKVPSTGPRRVATHSCNVTLLSFCSKFGMGHGTRRLLGYHTSGKDRSLLIYNRDSMSGPLRALSAMIEEIRAGRFVPVASRSGFFPLSDVAQDDEDALEPPALDVDSDSTSEDSHGSASEEDDDPTIEEKAVGKVVGTWNPVGASDVVPLVRHFVSRCIHVVEDEPGTSTKCGRMISTRYVRLIYKGLVSCTQFARPALSDARRL